MNILSEMTDLERGFEEEALAKFIASWVCDRASGRDRVGCVLNLPRDQYFIGNLRPVPLHEEGADTSFMSSELLTKLAPSAFGTEFRIRPDADQFSVRVNLHWACYYRVFPSFEQQLEHQQRQTAESNLEDRTDTLHVQPVSPEDSTPDGSGIPTTIEDSPEAAQTPRDRRRDRTPTDTLYVRFKKISCQATGTILIQIVGSGGSARWAVEVTDLQNAVDLETKRAQDVALADPENLRTKGAQDDQVRVPQTVLSDGSGKAFVDYCRSLQTQVVPQWKWEIGATSRLSDVANSEQERLLTVEFTNKSPMSEKDRNVEPFFFDPVAGFNFEHCQSIPFEFELAPRGFRYSPFRTVAARGFNCSISEGREEDGVELITSSVPFFRQRRYRTQSEPIARFDELAKQPIPVLENILASMRKYLEVWDQYREDYATQAWWNESYQKEYDGNLRGFTTEIERFATGLELIRSNADIHLAFALTNESFSRLPQKEKLSWRLFQIVFLVSQIPGIAALADPALATSDEREKVDIIYFPTGGGKTEAYLAVIVFHCFFDRLRGKRAGVTAWTRFPLRLLTLQQTQRVADILGLAELVRREQTAEERLSGKDVAGFAVGYFVGSNATPNKLSPPSHGGFADPDWIRAQDPKERQQWKRIIRCPSCRTNTVEVVFEQKEARLRHRCTRPDCKFESGYLPVYVVDNEIYRYLPSVIVGTIDKLAGIGNQGKMSLLFGKVEGYCQLHGYYTGKCCQDECADAKRLIRNVPKGLSGPTLFIQDELHLLKEGLGTFDAHYETFVQQLLEEFEQETPSKIIASSATIEAFERQVEHLYGRDPSMARVFPGPGPTLETSFYAETLDYPQRIFIGVIPHNKTIFNAILELIQYYHEGIQELQNRTEDYPNPYGGKITPGTEDWAELLDSYVTSLTYFLNTRELYSIKTDLEAAVNTDLERNGYRPLEIAELTGSVGTSDVAITLERLERELPTVGQAPDSILATSMISHGVDISRLNSMIFYGMPTQVAEYIQSSSRVGRSHVGLVCICHHPAKERDRSHYSYFPKFHEFLGQLVEPVAINRWSRFSVTRTLPGLFMAILLQLLAGNIPGDKDRSKGRYTRLDFVKKQIREGKIRSEQFIPFLEKAYGVVGINAPGPNAFRQEITQRVDQFIDQILGAGSHIEWVSEALIPQPMRSLRDVDEQLLVELDDNGTRWAART